MKTGEDDVNGNTENEGRTWESAVGYTENVCRIIQRKAMATKGKWKKYL